KRAELRQCRPDLLLFVRGRRTERRTRVTDGKTEHLHRGLDRDRVVREQSGLRPALQELVLTSTRYVTALERFELLEDQLAHDVALDADDADRADRLEREGLGVVPAVDLEVV